MAAAAAAGSTSTTATVASDTLHDIHLGASFLRRHDDDALVSLRYTQKPVSLGSAATGLLWVHPSSNANSTPPGTRNVLAAFPIETSTAPASGGSGQQRTGEVRFTGQVQNSKDVDCVLVWDEQLQSFSLERLDSSVRLALDRSSAPHPYPTPDPTQPYHPLASSSAPAPTTAKRRKINANGASTASSSSSSDEGTKPLSLARRAKHLLAGTDRGGKGSGSGSDTGRLNTPSASAGRSRTVSANAALSSSNRGANHRGHSKLAEVENFGSVYLSDNSPGKASSGLVVPNKNNNGSSTSGQDRAIQSSPIKPSSSSTGLMSSPGAAPPSNTMQQSAAKESPRIVPPPIDLIPAPGAANTTARATPPSRPTAASKRPALPPAPPGPGQRGSKSTLPPAAMKRPVAAMKSVPSRIDVSNDSNGEDASSDEDDDDDDDDSDEDGSDEEDDDDAAIPEGYLATPGQVFAGHLAMRESNSLQGYATLGGGTAGGKGAGMVQGGDLRGRSSMVQAIASGAMTRVSSAPPLSKSRDNQAMNVASSTLRTNASTVPTTSRSSNMAKDPSGSGSGSGNDASMIPGPPRGVGGIGKGKGAPPKAARAGKSVVVPPPPPPQRAQKGLPRTVQRGLWRPIRPIPKVRKIEFGRKTRVMGCCPFLLL
ncbi:BZ3500_MvSof-1268-A1-R1_Chr10-2g03037 [Microbotryum saponariae]|uniref:BZ3500_MvSof-1268-A1-R1_Chr10-2g03037 protein n=1 Tax=Microbotryum saponariae TaxID=289078 RepID=A0A2X0N4D8_9BASI|nr:BZ3501_MvSof-1269-A2-R1_Chr10-2g02623 [Microbotryum saponariae]SDA01972.1 BZ3500_MvSof-1268-A1-R1_Chr10-2g03037 [Microbotryum saponariae]